MTTSRRPLADQSALCSRERQQSYAPKPTYGTPCFRIDRNGTLLARHRRRDSSAACGQHIRADRVTPLARTSHDVEASATVGPSLARAAIGVGSLIQRASKLEITRTQAKKMLKAGEQPVIRGLMKSQAEALKVEFEALGATVRLAPAGSDR
jgi:hypothetical protein